MRRKLTKHHSLPAAFFRQFSTLSRQKHRVVIFLYFFKKSPHFFSSNFHLHPISSQTDGTAVRNFRVQRKKLFLFIVCLIQKSMTTFVPILCWDAKKKSYHCPNSILDHNLEICSINNRISLHFKDSNLKFVENRSSTMSMGYPPFKLNSPGLTGDSLYRQLQLRGRKKKTKPAAALVNFTSCIPRTRVLFVRYDAPWLNSMFFCFFFSVLSAFPFCFESPARKYALRVL